jgi:poly(hydroxyalkanoate) depolymerase family esterase
MYVHATSGKTPSAVVLALHGCTQTASAYVGAGWNEVADREGLVIVYGEQRATNNPMRCFRWFDAAQIGRDGEAKSLASMVTAAHAKYGTKRAFVTGLSAGGAMTSVMLAAYPELFEAGAIMAGLPYRCATSQADSFACMSGRSQSADAWAALVPAISAASAPRVSIWQGDADYTVQPTNLQELVKQWTKVNGISEKPDATTTEGRATHQLHHDASGVVRVESWTISKMGHGIALDPKSGCGTAGAYELDVGVCSTRQAAEFFLGTSPRPGSAGNAGNGGTGGGSSESNPCP